MATIRVSNIEAKADVSSPTVDEKVKVTSSDGRVLVNIDGKTVGVTSIGINTTSTSFAIDANQNVQFSGNITTGTIETTNLNVSGVTTATGGLIVGESFIRPNAVGLGATTTTGRNAGVGTATGTIVYNSSTGLLEYYNGTNWRTVNTGGVAATGGTITQVGGQVIHTFTGSGTFTVTNSSLSSVDYLVVAGGGGGGSSAGGGGGAGGFRTGTGLPVSSSPGSYTVTVGGGGNGGIYLSTNSTSGSNSIFSTITSAGGGAGGNSSGSGTPGGSGGGASRNPTATVGSGNTPPTSPPQGNNGGTGLGPPLFSGGGGGGAGGVGGNASPSQAGNGGNGTASTISGASVTYAGGGGGGSETTAGGTGGTGGGGNGGRATPNTPGTEGTANTGGGGGGGGNTAPLYLGSNGGSGIVIIAYPS
jgi:hypothetical protein